MSNKYFSATRIALAVSALVSLASLFFSILLTIRSTPCPLCDVALIFLAIILLVTLVAFFHDSPSRSKTIYGPILFFLSLLGVLLVIRLLWLQSHLNTEACSLSAIYLLKALSLKEALVAIWQGGGACSPEQLRLLGLTIAEWFTGAYAVLMVVSLGLIARPK